MLFIRKKKLHNLKEFFFYLAWIRNVTAHAVTPTVFVVSVMWVFCTFYKLKRLHSIAQKNWLNRVSDWLFSSKCAIGK